MPNHLTHVITAEESGQPVGPLLRRHFGLSAGLLRRLKLREGGITLDGIPVTVRATAQEGQCLAILTEGAREPQDILPVPGALDIVFEDAHLLILNKPAGLPVHPSRGHYLDTLANRVVAYLGPEIPFRAVNRLDRGTSGLLCLAKSGLAAQRVSAQLADRAISRGYLAVVEGRLAVPSGIIDAPINRVPGRGIMRQIDAAGKPAVTHFEVVRRGPRRTLVALRLETGRTHQIRVHMAHLGHPVTGDFMYGTELDTLDGQALHAASLELNHPITGERVRLTAAMPGYFEGLLQTTPPCHSEPSEEPCPSSFCWHA